MEPTESAELTEPLTLETLPAEILQQIVAMEPAVARSARQVSRTMLAATQRCRLPISRDERLAYLNRGPQFFAVFNSWKDVDRIFDTYQFDSVTFNLYSYANRAANRWSNNLEQKRTNTNFYYYSYQIILDVGGESNPDYADVPDQIEINDGTEESTNERLLEFIVNHMLNFDKDLFDLLMNWRILVARLGCIGSRSTNYATGVVDYARETLHHQLDSNWDYLNRRSNELITSIDPLARFRAVGLWLYWRTYLYVNALILNVWPLPDRNEMVSSRVLLKSITPDSFDALKARVLHLQQQVHRAIDSLNL